MNSNDNYRMPTKTSSDNLPERAFLTSYKLQKRKIKLVVPFFELPVENTKHPNSEWKGRGVDCFALKFPFLSRDCLYNFVTDDIYL